MSTKASSKSNKKHESSKHNAALIYLRNTLTFVALGLVIILPLCLVLLNLSVKAVHKVQPYFPKSISDYALSDEGYVPSEVTSGTVARPVLYAYRKIGVLRCDAIGLETPVYCGSNRLSRRSGAGLSLRHPLPGDGKEVLLSANTYGAFRNIASLEEDDEIVLETTWGIYRYRVIGSEISKEAPEADTFETLILSTQSSDEAFAALSDAKLYVTAEIASGPSLEEVQQ